MTREEMVSVAESYIDGLGSGDFSKVPFAEDVSYESPLSPRTQGQETIDFLSGLFPIMRGAEIIKRLGGEPPPWFNKRTHGPVSPKLY